MNLSFWERESFFKNIDVTIIGSGIVGLNAALCLKQKNPKLRVLILERGMLPMGASSKNAGFACFGSVSELLSDLQTSNKDDVLGLVEKRWKGLQRLRKNLGDKNIGFNKLGGYEVFTNEESFNSCVSQIPMLNEKIGAILGEKNIYRIADESIQKFGFQQVKHMIVNKAEGQIDTGMMITSLIRKVRDLGVEIINGFEVKAFYDDGDSMKIESNNGITFNSRRLIIATNGFASQLLPSLDVQPARAQVLISSEIKDLKLKGSFHFDEGYFYFRNIGNRVLLGGGRNLDFKTEATSEFGLSTLVQNHLESILKNIILPYAKFDIEMRWSGIMGLGSSKKSIVQKVSNNVFCAVRMGGMGIAIGSLVGEEVALLCEESL